MNIIKIQIKSFWGTVLFESARDNMKQAMQDAVLRGADLRGADLRDAVLRGAVLRGADLRDADLRGADLRGADLRGADLRGAVLQDAVLRGADLRDADLRGADLRDAVLRDAVLRGAVLRGADLRGADLRGADLRGAELKKLPIDFINQCSRDILFIFQQLKSELPKFKEKLLAGKINGSQYTGTCACLYGTFANLKNKDVDQVCKDFIPFYEKGTQNMGETWFLNIREGDTPKNNQFSDHVLKLLEMVESGKYYTITY